jgi:hypothetical protein
MRIGKIQVWVFAALYVGVAVFDVAAQTPGSAAASDGWFARVDRTQAEQPHWITPVVTVTPRLEEEFRFDFDRMEMAAGARTNNFGVGKGLELIPLRRVEIILGIPPYLTHRPISSNDGWGDTNFLIKYRLLASNERGRNGILTFFLGGSAPTASNHNGTGHWVWTPAIAAGKGWHAWDVQSTFGVAIPASARQVLGTPITWNTAVQYHVHKIFWPEIETNSTFWPNGVREGKKQIFLTPGLVIGKIHLRGRVGLTVGAGFQTAVTKAPVYNHALILTLRTPF